MQYVFVDGPANEDFESQDKFLKACSEYSDKTHSQNFQDVWALYENNFIKDGFYVEFGATDGVSGSNSYLLSKSFKWKGILAEPNPYWTEALTKNRKSKTTKIVTDCVYTETGKTVEFHLTEAAADLSSIVGYGKDDEHALARETYTAIKVNTVSLLDLLRNNDAPKVVNYLSVDTEGSEYDILSAFFNSPEHTEYDIKCITVEHNYVPAMKNNLFDLLSKHGYERKYERISKWDDFYVKVAAK